MSASLNISKNESGFLFNWREFEKFSGLGKISKNLYLSININFITLSYRLNMSLYNAKYSQQVGASSGYAGFRNRRRINLFTKLIAVDKEDHILEIGPNEGLLLDALKPMAKSVIGIDINKEAVRIAARQDIIWMNAESLAFKNESFNTVIGIEVFEHIPALDKVFAEIARVLVRGGKCYMTVPFEFFRGQQALGDAWHAYRDLRMCRQLHVHKLNPAKIKKWIAHTRLELTISKLLWIPGPSFYIVLTKTSN